MKTSLAAGMAAIAVTVHAQSVPTLYVAGYGGSSEKVFREQVIPIFEKVHKAKIEYVAGTSATNLARLQAERAKPEIDVAVLDDGPMQQAISLKLCEPIAKSKEFDALNPIARFAGDRAAGVGVVATGIAYNTDEFKARGWQPPTSWRDLADPKYKGQLLIPSVNNSYGLHALVMLARSYGGSESNIEPGFQAIEKFAPNVASFESTSSKMSELFQTKAVSIGVWGSGRAQALTETGFPLAFVYPKEGVVALFTSTCPVSGSDQPELAQAFVRHLMSPQIQIALAKGAGWGPTNKSVQLDPETADKVVYGPQAFAKLIAPNLQLLNDQKAEWAKRWARRVER